MSFFSLFDYSDFARINEKYAIFQNETKRRWIENRNAFDIFSDDNINFFSSSSDSLHDFIITYIHNRTLQNVTFIANNRFSTKKNRNHRVADFKNKRSLSSSDMWFYFMNVNANIVEIKFKKFTKRDRSSNSKIKTFTRFFRQSRVERYAFSLSFFFVIQLSRRSKRIDKKRVAKKEILFELRAQILLKNEKKKKFFEHAARAMNDNDFINLNQLLTLLFFSSMSCVTNRIVHRDDKLLSRKHMIVKTSQIRSKKYVISFLYTFENKCSHCFVYQYNEKCYEKTNRSKYWHCCFDDKIFNELFTTKSDFVNIKKLLEKKRTDYKQ